MDVLAQHQDMWKTLKDHEEVIVSIRNNNNNAQVNFTVRNLRSGADDAGLNRTQNAKLDRHFVYDERKADTGRVRLLGKYRGDV